MINNAVKVLLKEPTLNGVLGVLAMFFLLSALPYPR
ncbi:MAG: hypothetical protein ACJAXM_000899 [Arenicella sp.]|jgi:hypothetical protein